MPSRLYLPIALAATLLIAACSGTASLDPRRWFSRDTAPAPAVRESPGVEARLRGVGSATSGMVRLRESGDLLIVMITLDQVKPGPYRVVLHDNANCTSPNGFSAGAPWSPPGAKDPPARLIPELFGNNTGAMMTARLRGVRLGDVLKRSVLVYEGTTVVPPRPDVPNNVVACGTFVPSTTLF